jgi:small-conductance mechanosensitive channel
MQEILNYNLINIGNYKLNVFHLVLVAITLAFTYLTLFVFKSILNRSRRIETGRKHAIYQLFKYFVWTVSISLCLSEVGINLTVIIAGSAALLVGVGLGLQNLFNDFVSGLIILIDGSIKGNDVIEVDGLVAKVEEIRLRTSSVVTRDDKHIILPNSKLTANQLINWTIGGDAARFNVEIGVAYGSNTTLVTELLIKSLTNNKHVKQQPAPFVRFANFGESALLFELFFWTDNVFRVENIKSEIRFEIDSLFRENGVVIPFPQLTLHTVQN